MGDGRKIRPLAIIRRNGNRAHRDPNSSRTSFCARHPPYGSEQQQGCDGCHHGLWKSPARTARKWELSRPVPACEARYEPKCLTIRLLPDGEEDRMTLW